MDVDEENRAVRRRCRNGRCGVPDLADATVVLSDAQGRYAVESTRRWHFFLPFPEGGPAYFPRVTVSQPGYRNRVIDSWRRPWWKDGVVPEPITIERGFSDQPPMRCPTASTVEELPPESREPAK
jgi:hypothetical protein